MNIALVLSGGTGTRLGKSIPKQYIEIQGKPIIQYCLDTIQKAALIDRIVIVASREWQDYLLKVIRMGAISKFCGFAEAGSSRQHSILNGLTVIGQMLGDKDANLLIHDAARPNLPEELIEECINGLKNADGVMPVLPVKDTIYLSENHEKICSLLNRDQLFAGQAPESFRYKKYREIHMGMTEADLENVRGSSEMAYKYGLDIQLVQGDEHNYKITTKADLDKFRSEIEVG